MKTAIVFILVSSLMCETLHATSETSTVVKYRVNRGPSYYVKIIEAALASTQPTHGDYASTPFAPHIPTLRIIEEVIKGERINVHWTPALSALDTEKVSIIPIPLLKGLSGFRILAIRRDDQEQFSKVKNLQQLSSLKLAQVHGWFDIQIYQHNGIRTVNGARFDSLFAMLSAKRIGAIPIGAEQITDALNKRADRFPELAIEQSLIIYYPFPVFLYVSKSAPMLEARLRLGLENIIASGEFDRIFEESFASTVQALDFSKRKLFALENPFLYKDTPIERKELWLRDKIDFR